MEDAGSAPSGGGDTPIEADVCIAFAVAVAEGLHSLTLGGSHIRAPMREYRYPNGAPARRLGPAPTPPLLPVVLG
jgi:hypothetical protein